MKLLEETQCRVCRAKIAKGDIFCKPCSRDRFFGIPQYEWLLLFFLAIGIVFFLELHRFLQTIRYLL